MTSVFFRFLLPASLLAFSSESALAHVKWFVEFDIADPPTPISQLLSPLFIGLTLLSLLGITIYFFVESRWQKPLTLFRVLPYKHTDLPLNLIRIGTGIFCIILWLVGGVILTPELVSDAAWLPLVQLAIAFCLLLPQTLWLAGIGILVLYSYAIYSYGLFHLMDYIFFVGIGLFLIFSQSKQPALMRIRLPVLYTLLAFAFMWSAAEKLAHPEWFNPFLDEYPFLTMGFDRHFFIMTAAFVELAVFYLLLTGKQMVAIIALLANLLIISGNLYFGKVDTIGHFPANFLLLLIMIMGGHGIRVFPRRSIALPVAGFVVTCAIVLLLHYTIHMIEFQGVDGFKAVFNHMLSPLKQVVI